MDMMAITFLLLSHAILVYGSIFRPVLLSQNKKFVKDIISLRAGYPGQRKLWYYTGIMQNAMTSDTICGVEGLELISCLGHSSGGSTSKSFLSTKAFFYTDVNNRTSALRRYRRQKSSLARSVENVKLFHELVSYSTPCRGNISARVEFPSGRYLTNNNIEVNIDTKKTFSKMKTYRIMNRMLSNKPRNSLLNKWVTFRPPHNGNLAAREIYTLQSVTSFPLVAILSGGRYGHHVSMTLKRFGEGPSWMGGGKFTPCILELSGRRLRSVAAIPEGFRCLVSKERPQLLTEMSLDIPTSHPYSTLVNNSGTFSKRLMMSSPNWIGRRKVGAAEVEIMKSFRQRSDILDGYDVKSTLREICRYILSARKARWAQ